MIPQKSGRRRHGHRLTPLVSLGCMIALGFVVPAVAQAACGDHLATGTTEPNRLPLFHFRHSLGIEQTNPHGVFIGEPVDDGEPVNPCRFGACRPKGSNPAPLPGSPSGPQTLDRWGCPTENVELELSMSATVRWQGADTLWSQVSLEPLEPVPRN